MRTDMMQTMRHLIATEGDYGFLMAADEFDNSEDARNRKFGGLLRLYVEIQKFVRMSMPVPKDVSDAFIELNNSFDQPAAPAVGNWTESFGGQLGPFYTEFTADCKNLANNLNWLELEPVRKLSIRNCDASQDLALIFRNHRIGYITHLELQFKYREQRQEAEVGRIIAQLAASSLIELKIRYVRNRLKLMPAMFLGNKKLPKGCTFVLDEKRIVTHG